MNITLRIRRAVKRRLQPSCYAVPSIRLNLLRIKSFSNVMTHDHSNRAFSQSSGYASLQDQVGVQEPSSFYDEIS